jgi:F-type H+-transporting ATPase subunit epsilon
MAEKLHFDLVSPEQLLLSEEVDMVTVPGADGDFGVLAGHAPVISTIRPGFIEVKGATEGPSRIFVRGGFAEVTSKGLTVLAEEAIPEEDLNAADLDQQIKDAEEDLADAKTDSARQRAAETLENLRQIRSAMS